MKKILIFVLILFAVTACGSDGANTETVNINIEATQTIEARSYEATQTSEAREHEKFIIEATQQAEANNGTIVEVVTATPTNTPLGPTNTPTQIPPTNTPTPIPPTPTPTADPRLFWDDFENGIKPEWGMSGNGFTVVNGQLTVENGLMESQIVGNTDWHNYAVELDGLIFDEDTIQIRVQMKDKSNYIYLKCKGTLGYDEFCEWHKVIEGHDEFIAGTGFEAELTKEHPLTIEVEDNFYRVYYVEHNKGNLQMNFVDTNFNSGGISLLIEADEKVSIKAIKVRALP